MRDPAPRAGLLSISARWCRPVSARLGPPDPSDVAARLQRAGRSEPRDGCLWSSWAIRAYSAGHRRVGGGCDRAPARGRWREQHPSLVQHQSPRLAGGVRTAPHGPARQDRDHRPGRLCGVVRGHQGCNGDANGPRRVSHLPSRRGGRPRPPGTSPTRLVDRVEPATTAAWCFYGRVSWRKITGDPVREREAADQGAAHEPDCKSSVVAHRNGLIIRRSQVRILPGPSGKPCISPGFRGSGVPPKRQ
jgi:hypothetical protein